MTSDEIIKTYLTIGLAYIIVRAIKLIRKKDGISGWEDLKKEAIKKDLYMPELFMPLAVLVMLYCAATWPFSLYRIITRKRREA
jgi:hypothetical protein